MPVGTLNQGKDAYVSYEFVCVKCAECGEESSGFVYKEHLTPDETIEYIEEITGFVVRVGDEGDRGFAAGSGNYGGGGLECPACHQQKCGIREVAYANV
jgi:hypothetical protein